MIETDEELMNLLKQSFTDEEIEGIAKIEAMPFACIGHTTEGILIYSYERILEYCINNGMDKEAAEVFINYSIIDALPYIAKGDNMPMVIREFRVGVNQN